MFVFVSLKWLWMYYYGGELECGSGSQCYVNDGGDGGCSGARVWISDLKYLRFRICYEAHKNRTSTNSYPRASRGEAQKKKNAKEKIYTHTHTHTLTALWNTITPVIAGSVHCIYYPRWAIYLMSFFFTTIHTSNGQNTHMCISTVQIWGRRNILSVNVSIM